MKNNLSTLQKLVIVIEQKRKYLNTLMERGNKSAAYMLNSEINFLEKEILPIVKRGEA